MSFSPDYVRLVLNENFEDAKTLWLDPLMAIHHAHLVMLAAQRIVSPADARALAVALDSIDLSAVSHATYDGSYEDLFFYVNRLIADACNGDLAGRLHTARSRNDIDMTMYRMRLREWVLDLGDALLRLRGSLIEQSAQHGGTVFAAHTHGQPAQPTTVAHYLVAMIEQLERDTTRLMAAYAVVNACPLGACAITGTGFPIDRDLTSALLGFREPTGNTYGSIAAVDYLLQSAAAAAILLTGLGRFVQDMLFWSTAEVGYLRLPDGLVQTSSIMPQKRNPVALEHARALSSRSLGEINAIQSAVHNTPFGDIVDTEDDLQPLVRVAFANATRAVALVGATTALAEFQVARMRERAAACWVTATELADTLARDTGMSFTRAHALTAVLVHEVTAGGSVAPSAALNAAAHQMGYQLNLSDEDLHRILSPEHFVELRRTWGGPAPDVTRAAIEECRRKLAADEATMAQSRGGLAAAARQRRLAIDRLL
ncbi:MAG: argininosuccinate lyase [Vicinamibacterales bacterium]